MPRTVSLLLMLAVLAVAFVWKAGQNYHQQDYLNSNFFSFWLSGHMAWTGANPYDPRQWLAGFDAAGATYRPSSILQYPLPLMYFMAPIGILPLGQAYFLWQVVSLAMLALSVFLLLRLDEHARSLWLPLTLMLMFFGPVYLSLQVGSVGAFSLLALGLAIFVLGRQRPLLAGLCLSVLLLKPPQALTLMLLAGFWFLVRRQWKVLAGLALGGLLLLGVWLLRDPLGLAKFRGSSDSLLGHTLGVQSNVFAFSYLACGRQQPCMWVLGSLAMLLILAVGAYVLWRQRLRWNDWQAFDLIIPLGFVSALYLWSYDQLLYVIPLVWIIARLFGPTHSFLRALLVLAALDLVSFVALAVQAYTLQDRWSILNTLFVLGLFAWAIRQSARSSPQPSPGTSEAQ